MSCITENTIAIRVSATKTLEADINKVKDDYRISGFKQAFKNKDIAIYIFDCNGDQPWEIEDSGVLALDHSKDVIATETVYPEDGGRWTQVFDAKKGYLVDSSRKLVTYLKGKVTDAELEDIKKNTSYTYC